MSKNATTSNSQQDDARRGAWNKSTVLLGACLVLVCALLPWWTDGLSSLWWHAKHAAERMDAPAKQAEHAGTAQAGRTNATASPQRASQATEVRDWQAEYGCPDCPSKWHTARSAEEAAWLHRNGFAGRAERARLEALSDADLQARLDAGELTAGTVMLDRMIKNRKTQAHQFARQLAARGSTYALYRIAGFYARRPHLDPTMFAAVMRVAELRGDHVAADEIVRWQPKMLFAPFISSVDRHVLIFLDNLEQTRRQFGYPPLRVDIRPMPPDAELAAIEEPTS